MSPAITAQLVALILNKLNVAKGDTVCLQYSDYRQLFSLTHVPVIEEIKHGTKDGQGEAPAMVRVDRLQALEFLKNKYHFHRKDEIKDVILRERQKYVDEMG